MAKTYLIPHNFTNNGRVFNLFHKKDLTKAIIWFVPVTAIIFNLPLTLNTKLFCEILIAFPPAIAMLAGYANWVYYLIRFMRNRRIYYYTKEGEPHAYLYQGLKSSKNAAKSANIK